MTHSPDDDAHIEASRAPLLDHLIELRQRLIWSVAAFIVAFIGSYFVAKYIYDFLTHPLAVELGPNRRMIYTALYDVFFTYIKVAAFSAICISFPIIASQIYMFVAPGLYRNERRAFLPFLIAAPVFFAAGAALAYYGLMPVAIRFFLGFETVGGDGALPIQLEARVPEYLDFIMALIFGFGFSFQLPVLLTLLGRVGIVNSDMLKTGRRYALVAVFVIAAVMTPPDVLSQVALALPLYALFEASIWSVRLIEKQRADQAKKAESAV